ncbi:SURF1 family protein [Nocardioides cavernaquae]|uniref:SURF1-like protein n=1 Tax=Nocardioides cavernaquae TaxID=2321396 RepID=A0A3A5HAS1_9ACTN|nr:SURF1 family protein [Nocardioides cavernaquae]RJS47161.1 SURF1 family protein [Nocardioides cavernaquae]
MRSLSFLVSRRWVLFAIIVGLLAYVAWWLGEWQFHRLEDRRDRNAVIERNESASAVPVSTVLSTSRSVPASAEWTRITATGTYDVEHTVQVRYRTYEGNSGVEVVVPLVTSSGTAVLIDRGWLATDTATAQLADIPDPPTGTVTVTGWARADATGESTAVSGEGGAVSTRAISSRTIAAETGLTTYQGFVQLDKESPEPATALRAGELPDLGNGPHFFYGLQWWFFGVLAIFGFGYLAYDEWRILTARKAPRRQG